MNTFDIAVIGAGSGGTVAAELAAKLGAKTVLIEKEQRLGGECLHYGCVPSKSLIHAARLHHQKQSGKPADFGAVKKHIVGAIDHIEHSHDNDAYFHSLGVTVLHGDSSLQKDRHIQVGDQTIRAKKIIITTGSSPFIPPIEGINAIDYLTNESIFSIDSLPKSLVVVGGGPIGCELGQAFAMLGSSVTLVNSGDRLLSREEPDASAALEESMTRLGVTIIHNAKAVSAQKTKGGVEVRATVNDSKKTISGTHVLMATGRKGNVPRGVQTAGITTTKRGIEVNNKLQTSNRHIYAVGDCNGGVQFTHAASEQAGIAVQHALFGFSKKSPPVSAIPWATFTSPEIAHVGETADNLSQKGKTFVRLHRHFGDIDKAVTEQANGWVELLVTNKGHILGATVVGNHASELINYIAHVKNTGTVKDFNSSIHVYPTYGLALKQLAVDFIVQNYNSGLRRALLALARKLRP